MTCQRVKNCGLASASSNSAKASSRPSARSSETIICSRELASSVLLAPMNWRVSLSYSTPTGAAPARATAWKNKMSLSACSMTKLSCRPSTTISSPSSIRRQPTSRHGSVSAAAAEKSSPIGGASQKDMVALPALRKRSSVE
jgi:hypothetical protein